MMQDYPKWLLYIKGLMGVFGNGPLNGETQSLL